MPSTNGHGPKRAILYARVSTDEQARSGYSLAQQLEALREYAAKGGYGVLEEVSDPGQSGASLERPGMDHVRDLVAAGGVSVVLAQDRDRFAREPAYHYLLRREFEEHGTKIRALNDRGDESPEGELTDGILDQLAKYERAKIAERTRRGKLRKAREGKIAATRRPPYGFSYNATRDGYIVNEREMVVVEKIFRLAAEGFGTSTIQSRLYHENIPSPAGIRSWQRSQIKRVVLNDVYRPHTFEETAALVSAEVAATLDPAKEYGIRWWNRVSQKVHQVSKPSGNGERRYRRRTTSTKRDREEWIAVPVSAYLPRYLVDQARTLMAAHRPPQRKNLARHWELRGLVRCGCGVLMATHTTTPNENPTTTISASAALPTSVASVSRSLSGRSGWRHSCGSSSRTCLKTRREYGPGWTGS
jgi:site-specific DNA recombinase